MCQPLKYKKFRRSSGITTHKPSGNKELGAKKNNKVEDVFEDYTALKKRIGKTMYYAGCLPSSPRPSFPLTVFAVNAFTNSSLGIKLNTLEFLDLDLASQIGRNARISPTVVIMALIYLNRLKTNKAYLKTVKPSGLFITALFVASKFFQDGGEANTSFFDGWGASAVVYNQQRLEKLEIKFLSALNWNLKVDLDEFISTLTDTERSLSLQEGRRRGWFTYTELYLLLDTFFNLESFWIILYIDIIQSVAFGFIVYISLLATILMLAILTPKLIFLSRSILIPNVSQLPFLTPLIPYDLN